ncbi:MAG: hypothetical protein ACK4TK_10065 [Thiobacillaceae bacterium]
MDVYVGVHAFEGEIARKALVDDWRAPISSLYCVRAEPTLPVAGGLSGEITCKRQFRIRDGALALLLEGGLTILDDDLQKPLSQAADVRTQMKKIDSGRFVPADIDLFQDLQWAYAEKPVSRPAIESVDVIDNPDYAWPAPACRRSASRHTCAVTQRTATMRMYSSASTRRLPMPSGASSPAISSHCPPLGDSHLPDTQRGLACYK